MSLQLNRRELLTLFLSAQVIAPARARPQVRGAPPPDALLRGFNLPDLVPLRAEPPAAHVKAIETLHKMGMSCVRLPVEAESVMTRFSGPATISATRSDLTRAVEKLLAAGYHVTIDLHPGAEFQGLLQRDQSAAQAALLKDWPILARFLAQWPAAKVSAELLNEPATRDSDWRPFVEKLAQAVRAELAENTIIVGSAPFQRMEQLTAWTPLADKNIVYACHFYDPMMFTHQGATWEPGSPWAHVAGVPFPTVRDDRRLIAMADAKGEGATSKELRQMAERVWDAVAIAERFSAAAEWSRAHQAPIVVNEFGVLKWKAPRSARLTWLAAVRSAAEACGFGWAHWDYAGGFGLLDDAGALDAGVMHALLG